MVLHILGDRFYRLVRGLMTRPGTFPQGIIRVDRRLRILKMRRRQANYLNSIKDMAMLDILGSSVFFSRLTLWRILNHKYRVTRV